MTIDLRTPTMCPDGVGRVVTAKVDIDRTKREAPGGGKRCKFLMAAPTISSTEELHNR